MTVIVAGNWKMNMGPLETLRFFERFDGEAWQGDSETRADGVEILIFPPSLSLQAAKAALDKREPGAGRPHVALGVQNIHWKESGALTGEISSEMAAEAGAEYALVGHSERRHVFGETDSETSLKVAAAQRTHLTPVLCVGETEEERLQGRLEEVVTRQVDAVLNASEVVAPRKPETSDGSRIADFIVAYEPVWAIGTGRTATPEDAGEAHGLLRERLSQSLGPDVASSIPLLYGGSVNPDNVGGLVAVPDLDGVLVGGASLDPATFAELARAAS